MFIRTNVKIIIITKVSFTARQDRGSSPQMTDTRTKFKILKEYIINSIFQYTNNIIIIIFIRNNKLYLVLFFNDFN